MEHYRSSCIFGNDYIVPWFSIEKWLTLGSGIAEGLSTKWNVFVTWWNETGIISWWNVSVSVWFTLEKWNEFGENIKAALKEKWESFVSWWENTGICDWWNQKVVPWFSKEKWDFSGIKDGLSAVWDSAIDAVKRIWNEFAGWLNERLTWTIDPINIAGIPLFSGATINLGKVPMFTNGGFPEDGLFFANHHELIGKFSNGKTAVVNNNQILQGISDAVYPAVYNAMIAGLKGIGASDTKPEIRVFIGDREITDVAIEGINERTRVTGTTPLLLWI